MSEHVTSRLPKTPFVIADLSLMALAGWIVYGSGWPIGPIQIAACFVALAVAAWIGMMPFLREYEAATRVAEANALSTALDHIAKLESIQKQISRASDDWDVVRQGAVSTVAAAREIAERMKAEGEEFRKFFERANESEKAHLRLEVEKLKRAETEWLQVTIRILDHVYALSQAASRTGQPGLISELAQFQHACRDVARRMGLIPLVPERGGQFDEAAHLLVDQQGSTPPNSRIREVVATGYSFRGQLLRKPMIAVGPEPQTELPFSGAA